jgi:hypothetical protein
MELHFLLYYRYEQLTLIICKMGKLMHYSYQSSKIEVEQLKYDKT